MRKCCIFSSLELSTFAFNQFEEKGFNAKLVAKSFPHNRTHTYIFPHTKTHTHTLRELITRTTFHCAIHLNQLSHQRQYILPSISLPLSNGVIEGCKEEDVSAHRLLPQSTPPAPSTPPSPSSPNPRPACPSLGQLLSACGFLCL